MTTTNKDLVHVPASPTLQRVAELQQLGWSRGAIARAIGGTRLRLGRHRVTSINERLIADLHDRVVHGGQRPDASRDADEDDLERLHEELADVVRSREASWRRRAACAGLPHAWFFDPEYTEIGEAVCLRCTVQEECSTEGHRAAAYAIIASGDRDNAAGVWGGRWTGVEIRPRGARSGAA